MDFINVYISDIDSEESKYEELPVQHLSGSKYRLLSSPAFVLNLAKDD